MPTLEEFSLATEYPPKDEQQPATASADTVSFDEFMGASAGPTDQYPNDDMPPVWRSIVTGVANAAAMTYRSPEFVANMIYAPQNIVAEKTGWNVGFDAKSLPVFQKLESVAKMFDESAAAMSYRARQYEGETLDTLISKGLYAEAGDYLAQSIVENAPQSMIAIAASAAGQPNVGLGLMGVQTGAQSVAQARAAKLDEMESLSFGIQQGSLEVLGESLGSMKFLSWGQNLFKELGPKAGKAILIRTIKLVGSGALTNSVEEFATQLGQDLSSIFMGVESIPVSQLIPRAIEAAAIGAGSGGLFEAPGAALSGLRVNSEAHDTARSEAIKQKVNPSGIAESVVSQLKAAGFDESTAQTYATLYDSAFKTLGARAGVAPEELFKRYGLQIGRTDTPSSGAMEQSAFHGTPHTFEKFDLQKIGTGEGVAAYGWGLYFAGNKEVADYYRKQLAGNYEVIYKGKTLKQMKTEDSQDYGSLRRALEIIQENGSIAKAQRFLIDAIERNNSYAPDLANLYRAYFDQIDSFNPKDVQIRQPGRTYKVEIPDDEQYLDWDKPLSEQSEEVQRALDPLLQKHRDTAASATGRELYDRLSKDLGGSRNLGSGNATYSVAYRNAEAASKHLLSLGISGIKFADQQSRGQEKQTHNYVIFDDNLVQIKGFEQSGKNGPRGQIRFSDGSQFRIDLLPTADLSTFLHETGHFYLEVLKDLASDSNASGDLLTDYQAVRAWLGASAGQPFTVEQHEQFARGFEAYLAEGIAPTSALEAAFKRFKAWLLAVYEDLKKLNVELTPEVRGVFDRLLTMEESQTEEADPYEINRTMIGKQVKGAFGSDLREAVDKLFVPISTRLGEIHESLRVAVRRFDFELEMETQRDLKAMLPILSKMAKLSREDFADLDFALKNRDENRAQAIAAKDKISLAAARKTLDALFERAKSAGVKMGYLENYWPRRVRDVRGFLDFMRKSEHWSAIQEAITQREAEIGQEMTSEERVEFINSLIRGFGSGNIKLKQPENAKERLIPVLTPEMNRFYKTSTEAMYDYIVAMNQAIQQRKFFGKDADTLEQSVGAYMKRLVEQQQITAAEEKTVHDILVSRFNQRGTHGFWSLYKNVTYMATMGSPISAITQIQDLYYSMFKNGYVRTLWKLPGVMAGQTEIKPKDLGLDRIAEEFSGTSRSGQAVNKLFHAIGLSWMDGLGKTSVIDGEWQRLKEKAAKSPIQLEASLSVVFDKGAKRVVADIQKGVVSDDVKFLLWSAIADYQPISLSEQPEAYLTAGNGRIFYMLKTFTIKQIDVYRREVFSEMKSDPVKATGNLFRLTMALMLMGATADLLKDLLLGRAIELSDLVVDNILKTVGFSKWQIYKTRMDGPLTTFMQSILPPVPFFDYVYKDVIGSREMPNWRIWGRVPVVGKFYYWWMGGGANPE